MAVARVGVNSGDAGIIGGGVKFIGGDAQTIDFSRKDLAEPHAVLALPFLPTHSRVMAQAYNFPSKLYEHAP